MANVMFKRGPSSRVPYTSGAIEGAFYLTEDTNKLYVGTSEGKAVLVGKQITTISTLTVNPNTGKYDLPAGHQDEFLYIEDENIFAVWKDGVWVQINQNTNTTYDLELDGSATNKATIKLGAKNIGDTNYTYTEEFGIVGGDNVNVTVNTDGNIEIDVDLSAYDTIESVNGKVGAVQDEVDAIEEYVGTFTSADENVKTVVDYIDARTSNIASDDRVKALEDKVNHTESGLDTKASITQLNEVDGKFANYDTSDEVDGKIANFKTNTTDVIDSHLTLVDGYATTALAEIRVLNGEAEDGSTTGDKGKSVRTIAAEEAALKVAEVVADADEDFDTLKEIADWILSDTTGAAALQTKVSNLENNKADKATTLEGYGITDAYTKTEVDGLVDDLEQAIEDLPDVTVAKGTGIDVAKSGDEYTVSLEAITKNDTTGTAKTQETKGTLSFDAVTGVTYDAYGRVTGVETTNITVVDTDTTIEDTHNHLDTVTVATAQVTDGASASVTHTVTMTDGETKNDVFNITSSYTEVSGGVKVEAGEKSVNIDLVWGSF